ncbi:Saposin, chordata [Trema orientale]|uniref:Pulmonary surfactant-associated protein B n=1 Tax=Trema orientale TaxID=63057 RepID=A0A2P5F9E9_TREOI|nr:Saposin, chordata [Trema orientale]
MEMRVGLLVLFLLVANWVCDARQLANPYLSEIQIRYEMQDREIQVSNGVSKNDKVCTLCEEYAAQALDYLDQNKTQTEIIEILHQSCSKLHSFKPQACDTLVDYYAPLFFLEISTIQPSDFCKKVNLCEQIVMISSQLREDSCGLCHHAVEEVLTKLKDPDTKMEIIEVLLKACNSIKDYERKCKSIVFEYGPLFLANAQKYLENADICTTLHACKSPKANSWAAEETLRSDS